MKAENPANIDAALRRADMQIEALKAEKAELLEHIARLKKEVALLEHQLSDARLVAAQRNSGIC